MGDGGTPAVKRYRDIAGDGGSNIVGQVEAQQARLRQRLARVRRVVAIASGKGGVGKSSVTANLAAALTLSGWSVGIFDADLNGPSIAKLLGIRGRTLSMGQGGVEPPRSALGVRAMSMDLLLAGDATPLRWAAPTQAEAHTWRGTMEANALREFLADTVWGELDLLLIDLPPGTDRLTTIAGLLPTLHGLVVVTIPSEVAHLVVRRSISAVQGSGVPVLGLIENMAGYACPDCGAVNPLFAGPGGASLAREADIPFLGAIPFDPRLAAAGDRGQAFVATETGSPSAAALVSIAAALRRALADASTPARAGV
jgi:ATP-binding protein involved in chromosome partitioning